MMFACKPLKAVEIQVKVSIPIKPVPGQVENPKEEPKVLPVVAPVQPVIVAPIPQIDPIREKIKLKMAELKISVVSDVVCITLRRQSEFKHSRMGNVSILGM